MPDLKTVLSHFEAIVTEPVMVAFSGGADSVLVLKLALEASRGRVPVYALYADAVSYTHLTLPTNSRV